MKKRILACTMSIIMLLSLAACGGSTSGSSSAAAPSGDAATPSASSEAAPGESSAPAESSGATGRVINVAMTVSMGDLDPFSYSSTGRNAMRYTMYEYLAIFKEFGSSWQDMEWVLAKNVTQQDDVTYRVEIYDYIVDAIGNPITSSDIKFCFDQMAGNGNWTRITRYLDSCEIVDDYTVDIKLTSPLVGVIEYLMCQVNIVSEKTYNENKDNAAMTPITTAAYQVTECVNGSYYVLEKNENYWQTDESLRSYCAQQQVDGFKVNIFTEASQATIAMQMGEVDMITNVRSSELGNFEGNPDYTVSAIYESTPVSMLFNMDSSNIFADNLALRQAICYAVDSQTLITGALDGRGKVSYDIAPDDCADFNPKWATEDYYNTDLEKAKALVAESGYSGQTLRLITEDTSGRKDVAVIIQAQLAEIGITLEVSALDSAMYSDYQYDPTRWDISILKQGTEAYISNIYDGFMLQNKDGVGAKNFIKDDKLEELLNANNTAATHSEESADALHYYVKENALAYGLYQGQTFSAGKAGIVLVNHPWAPLVFSACDYSEFLSK